MYHRFKSVFRRCLRLATVLPDILQDAYFIEFAFAQNNVTGPHLIPAVIASDLASRVARPGPSASSGISKAYHAPLPLLQLGSVAPGDLLKAAAGLEATNGNLAGVLKGLFLTFSTKEGVMPPSKASAVRMFVEALNDGQDDAATAKPLWPLDLGDSDSDDDYEEEWESVGTPESLLALIRVRFPCVPRRRQRCPRTSCSYEPLAKNSGTALLKP